ncbi:hypothetical protein GCM10020295_14190 [Streptomyces cinereospinus]
MDLAFLHPLYEHPGPWASVYVDLSRHAEDTPHERHLTAEAMSRELAGRGADEATCRAVRDAIEEPRHSPEPHGRALFARAGEVVLDPPLARAPQHGWAAWAPLPRAAPLLDLTGEDAVAVVAYIDRRGAGFELRSALARETAGSVTGGSGPCTAPAAPTGRSGTSSSGWRTPGSTTRRRSPTRSRSARRRPAPTC